MEGGPRTEEGAVDGRSETGDGGRGNTGRGWGIGNTGPRRKGPWTGEAEQGTPGRGFGGISNRGSGRRKGEHGPWTEVRKHWPWMEEGTGRGKRNRGSGRGKGTTARERRKVTTRRGRH